MRPTRIMWNTTNEMLARVQHHVFHASQFPVQWCVGRGIEVPASERRSHQGVTIRVRVPISHLMLMKKPTTRNFRVRCSGIGISPPTLVHFCTLQQHVCEYRLKTFLQTRIWASWWTILTVRIWATSFQEPLARHPPAPIGFSSKL